MSALEHFSCNNCRKRCVGKSHIMCIPCVKNAYREFQRNRGGIFVISLEGCVSPKSPSCMLIPTKWRSNQAANISYLLSCNDYVAIWQSYYKCKLLQPDCGGQDFGGFRNFDIFARIPKDFCGRLRLYHSRGHR